MGLLDGYFDPQQFGEGGGLLGRLLALQQSQGLYQPGANPDQAPSAPPVPLLQPTSWSILPLGELPVCRVRHPEASAGLQRSPYRTRGETHNPWAR